MKKLAKEVSSARLLRAARAGSNPPPEPWNHEVYNPAPTAWLIIKDNPEPSPW